VWVISTVIFPLINNQIPFLQNFWEVMAFFVYFYALTIPSDLRDMTTDSSGLKTLPQLIGPKHSKYVALLLLITFSWMLNIHYDTYLFCLPVTIQLFLVLRDDASDISKKFIAFVLSDEGQTLLADSGALRVR
jgi:4-hydroxybenzoate polyprenyltransferase